MPLINERSFSAARGCISAHWIFGARVHWNALDAGHFRWLEKAWARRYTRTNGECHHGIHHKYDHRHQLPTICHHHLFTGLIWGEINSLYSSGLAEYIGDLWNIIDFISNTFHVTWIGLRITSWYVVQVSSQSVFIHLTINAVGYHKYSRLNWTFSQLTHGIKRMIAQVSIIWPAQKPLKC